MSGTFASRIAAVSRACGPTLSFAKRQRLLSPVQYDLKCVQVLLKCYQHLRPYWGPESIIRRRQHGLAGSVGLHSEGKDDRPRLQQPRLRDEHE